MTERTFVLSELLSQELAGELAKTRKSLERVPDASATFKPHERSMPLLTLANHLTTVSGFVGTILTEDGVDMATPSDPRRIVKEAEMAGVLRAFDELVAKNMEAVKATDDARFHDHWELKRQGNLVVAGTRYAAYRNMGVNHMIHHRAQLGVYLRQLELPVPALFGPSADEK